MQLLSAAWRTVSKLTYLCWPGQRNCSTCTEAAQDLTSCQLQHAMHSVQLAATLEQTRRCLCDAHWSAMLTSHLAKGALADYSHQLERAGPQLLIRIWRLRPAAHLRHRRGGPAGLQRGQRQAALPAEVLVRGRGCQQAGADGSWQCAASGPSARNASPARRQCWRALGSWARWAVRTVLGLRMRTGLMSGELAHHAEYCRLLQREAPGSTTAPQSVLAS